MKAWIQALSKSDLIAEMESIGLDSEGNIDELRRRMRRYIDEHPEMFQATARSPANASPVIEAASAPSAAPRGAPADPASVADDPARTLNTMRKWGIHFEGKDPWAFLERVDELRDSYGLTDRQLLRGLPELLRGSPLLWYRNTRDSWATWEDFLPDFRVAFLPHRFRAQLRSEIHARFQKPNETYF